MIKFFKIKKDKKNRAFTLVETLVALSIFTLSILALMVALGGGLKDTNYAKGKMTASFLAQEGIELMRNMRDTYVLYDGDTNGWAEFLAHVSDCTNNKGCIFHTEDLIYDDQIRPITQIEIEPCGSSYCKPLYYHPLTGVYDYSNTGNPETSIDSGYIRHIRIEEVGNDHEARIHVFVFWNGAQHQINFKESIFDWNKKI